MTLEQFLINFINDDIPRIAKPRSGLCVNIEENCPEECAVLFKSTFESWEHFSGSLTYPIIDVSSHQSSREQYFMGNLYKGKQLELRKNLAQHALDVLYRGKKRKLTIIDKLLRRK